MWSVGGMILPGGTEVLGEALASVTLCTAQFPPRLTWDRTGSPR